MQKKKEMKEEVGKSKSRRRKRKETLKKKTFIIKSISPENPSDLSI